MRLRRLLPLAALGLAAWYVRKVHRFRDPVRVLRAQDTRVISPADGVVCFVRRVAGGLVEAGPDAAPVPLEPLTGSADKGGWLLGIYVGPLDVHYTYQPVSGTVGPVTPGGGPANVPLLSPAARAALLAGRPADLLAARGTLENERMNVTFHSEVGDVSVALVAPGAALDVMPYLKAGDRARAGHKLAFLPEGGVVLLHLPATLTPLVSVGDRVTGLQSVVAGG